MSEINPTQRRRTVIGDAEQVAPAAGPTLRPINPPVAGQVWSKAHRDLVELMFADEGEFADHVQAIGGWDSPPPAGAEGERWVELTRGALAAGPLHLSLDEAAELATKHPHHLCLLRTLIENADLVPEPWVDALEYVTSHDG